MRKSADAVSAHSPLPHRPSAIFDVKKCVFGTAIRIAHFVILISCQDSHEDKSSSAAEEASLMFNMEVRLSLIVILRPPLRLDSWYIGASCVAWCCRVAVV